MQSLNRFDPKYASFGPRAPRPRPAAPLPPHPPLATFTPSVACSPDKYATVRPSKRQGNEPQPLSAAALEYRSLQRPRRQQDSRPPQTGTTHRRRPQQQPQHDTRDLYAVTEL
ncbi:hypothetical protein JYU34_012427 [Plutella xylostella]|uniref:Uncharacterized protein n=2 Tax=Plutella xylostella TaxID=51655 RepID=A0ABQ7QEZ8_PLUXY|nr:hypothetical protein JYU34_012427 [Plutella xylostella]CAG9133435.1 unnamed protein product [Plutella xylostella]